MTFKHTKFEDSVVMRSLERVAREKNFIQDEPIIKSAEKITDLNPTSTLFENVIKLSAALKNIGLETFAIDLENKLLDYKKAQTLYQTSKRTGDDLIDEAHPEGSHKLNDVDSKDAIFYTILDKHLSILDTVNKNPTGKLAKNQDIFKAVLFAFAQQTNSELEANIKENLNKAIKLYSNIDSIISERGSLSYLPGGRGIPYKSVSKHIKDLFAEEMTVDKINEISKLIKKVKSFVSPGLTGGVSEDAWDIIEPLFEKFDPYFSKMLEDRHQINKLERESFDENVRSPVSTTVLSQEAKTLFYAIDPNIKSLESYKPLINSNNRMNAQQKAAELNWIDSQIKELQDIKNAGPNENTYDQLSKLFGPNGDITQYYKSRAWLKPQQG